MRILNVVSSLDPARGGVAEGLRQSALATARLGHHEEVATMDAPGAPWLGRFPAPTHALGPGWGQLPLQRASRAMAEGARRALRCARGPWPVAIPRPCRATRLARLAGSVLPVRARHARSLVQAASSDQASEEAPLLAVGRLARRAGCARGAFHVRGRMPARAAIVRAVPRQPGRARLRPRHRCRSGRRYCRSLSRVVPRDARAAQPAVPRPASSEEGLRSAHRGVRARRA